MGKKKPKTCKVNFKFVLRVTLTCICGYKTTLHFERLPSGVNHCTSCYRCERILTFKAYDWIFDKFHSFWGEVLKSNTICEIEEKKCHIS